MLLIGIESIGGFIQNQDLRIVDQRLRQSHAAAKALGQGFDDLLDHRCQAQPIDDDARRSRRRSPVKPRMSATKSRNSLTVISP